MTVALLGVGADSSNCSPTPPVYSDGTFEYIPSPERNGAAATNEPRTFGNTRLTHQDRVIAEFLDHISPEGDAVEEEAVTGMRLEDWPLHYDPNFQALTYGATAHRGAYVDALRELEPDDMVAFYASLEHEDEGSTHRYVIGYFAVAEVIDFEDLDPEDDAEEIANLMYENEENAHAKRYDAAGTIDEGLVIVDGTDPGTLLHEAFKISEHGGGGHYYLTDDLQEQFDPEEDDDDKNAYLGGGKQAHLLNVDPEEFVETVG